jgi:uncharacterized membrane protein
MFYKLIWIFALMSFFGYLLETVAFYIRDGVYVSRQGMLYGPFNEIYGVGAIVLIFTMRKLSNRSFIFLTFFCAVIGGLFEYLNSVLLENIFGVIYWDYTKSWFNIYGRTDVLNDLAWGVLGAIVIKIAYPNFVIFFRKVLNRPIIIITWIMVVFFTIDGFLTISAIARETQRHHNIPATNFYQRFLDKTYPDSYIQSIYPRQQIK